MKILVQAPFDLPYNIAEKGTLLIGALLQQHLNFRKVGRFVCRLTAAEKIIQRNIHCRCNVQKGGQTDTLRAALNVADISQRLCLLLA